MERDHLYHCVRRFVCEAAPKLVRKQHLASFPFPGGKHELKVIKRAYYTAVRVFAKRDTALVDVDGLNPGNCFGNFGNDG